jgi:hypothetical protein
MSRRQFCPTVSDQLRESDIMYIPLEREMTKPTGIMDCFTYELLVYQYLRSLSYKEVMKGTEDTFIITFGGEFTRYLILFNDYDPQYISRLFQGEINLLRMYIKYLPEHSTNDNGDIESLYSLPEAYYVWPFESSDFDEAQTAIDKKFADFIKNRTPPYVEYLPWRN